MASLKTIFKEKKNLKKPIYEKYFFGQFKSFVNTFLSKCVDAPRKNTGLGSHILITQ